MALMMALRDMVGAATRQILACGKAGADIATLVGAYGNAIAQAIGNARPAKRA